MLNAEIWTIAQAASAGPGDGSAVLLRPHDMDVAVPVFIGRLEVQSILVGKEGISLPRPLTHDLFLELLASQKLSLERVEIHKLVEETFHARLVITGGKHSHKEPLFLDSRPSDAFALAVRRKCPVLVSAEIVSKTGIPLELILETPENDEDYFSSLADMKKNKEPSRTEKIRMFQDLLHAAVAKEDYEKAAEIRDYLKELER